METLRNKILVQQEDFDIAQEQLWLADDAGAICLFTGLVRHFQDTNDAQFLFIEHYPGMLEKQLASIADNANKRWKVKAIVIIHRYGKLLPGENIVLVGVSSKHRAEAFAACEYIMDYLKTDAPLWKKESWRNNQAWVEKNQVDDSRRQSWEYNQSNR